jgi:hypothetical protein
VLRVGRQAITWGNGLSFSLMDIVNPFDPVTVNTEYKPGDAMIYSQILRDNANDIELVCVFRHDPQSDDPDASAATTAPKYHAIVGASEYDALAATNYEESTLAFSGNRSIGGAVLQRADGVSGAHLSTECRCSHSVPGISNYMSPRCQAQQRIYALSGSCQPPPSALKSETRLLAVWVWPFAYPSSALRSERSASRSSSREISPARKLSVA